MFLEFLFEFCFSWDFFVRIGFFIFPFGFDFVVQLVSRCLFFALTLRVLTLLNSTYVRVPVSV